MNIPEWQEKLKNSKLVPNFNKPLEANVINKWKTTEKLKKLSDDIICKNSLRRRNNKRLIMTALGNECACCQKPIYFYPLLKKKGHIHESRIHLHHIDDLLKVAEVSYIQRQTNSLAEIFNEAQKTVMVCSTCHSKIHHGQDFLRIDIQRFDVTKLPLNLEELEIDGFEQMKYDTKKEIANSEYYKICLQKSYDGQEYYRSQGMPMEHAVPNFGDALAICNTG